MKNVISRGWDPAYATDNKMLGEADRAVVRDNLVEALIFAVPVVRTQLGLCLRSIAQVDYPSNWPGLVPAICANLQQRHPERMYGALFALRTLVKVYEFRQEPQRAPLHAVVEQAWPLMAQLLEALIPSPGVEGSELALLAMKASSAVAKAFVRATTVRASRAHACRYFGAPPRLACRRCCYVPTKCSYGCACWSLCSSSSAANVAVAASATDRYVRHTQRP